MGACALQLHSGEQSNFYVGQSSILKSIFREKLVIKHAEIFWEPLPQTADIKRGCKMPCILYEYHRLTPLYFRVNSVLQVFSFILLNFSYFIPFSLISSAISLLSPFILLFLPLFFFFLLFFLSQSLFILSVW